MLNVKNLTVSLTGTMSSVPLVSDVNFDLMPGHSLGIVGESGSGKSMTALSLMRLLPDGIRAEGSVALNGKALLTLTEKEMCSVRGNEMAMIFQEPMTSLNPVQTIGHQIAEPLILHKGWNRLNARREAIQLLERVGIPQPTRRVDVYPHQLSGGQRQRVMIAIALSCSPRVVIADEPTTALDVTVQRQILDLLRELAQETNMALIIISHDLGVISETADEMLVMYGGRVVEFGSVVNVLNRPAHPYTRRLIDAIPRFNMAPHERLKTIPGSMPEPGKAPLGCIFADRCDLARSDCLQASPPLISIDTAHMTACFRSDEEWSLKDEFTRN